MKSLVAIAGLSLALLALPAAAQDQDAAAAAAAPETMIGMMKMRPGMEMSEADKGYAKAMETMHQSLMETEMTGDASGDFARMMIPHHQSAIDMVDVLLAQKDLDPKIKKLAEKMKKAQTEEIAELRAWLDARSQ